MKYDNPYRVIARRKTTKQSLNTGRLLHFVRNDNYKKYIRLFVLWMAILIGLNACGPNIINEDIGGEDFKGANAQPLTYDPESHWIRQTQSKITVMIRYLPAETLMNRPTTVNYPPSFEIGVINESGVPVAINRNFIYLSDGSKPLPEVDIAPLERTNFCTFFSPEGVFGSHSTVGSHSTDCDTMAVIITIIFAPAAPVAAILCLVYDIPECEHIYHKNRDIFNSRVESMNNVMLQDTVIQPGGTIDGWLYFSSLPASGTLTISLRDTTTNALKTFVFNL